jgi:hypothetical protein
MDMSKLIQPGSSQSVSFLSFGEEILLVKLYLTKITVLCHLFRFPEEVEATAVSYMKRFYLKNTVMDWHPKNVMYVSSHLLHSDGLKVELQVDCSLPRFEDNKQPHLFGDLYLPHSEDFTIRRTRARISGSAESRF